ncbi:MAG: DNA polymerase III subunit chi [Rubrivivax sp.]|nr:DNA polymerase III subunit chi [Rubrivivax sp.]
MTEVEFHTGVADSVGFTCRLLRKACRQGARVLVTAPDEVLRELDRQLWTFEEREFVPHVRMPGASAAVAARTPVWLAASTALAGAPGVVVNLGADAPDNIGALERLIEVVAADPEAATRGRERWRAYKAAGLDIQHHAAIASRD